MQSEVLSSQGARGPCHGEPIPKTDETLAAVKHLRLMQNCLRSFGEPRAESRAHCSDKPPKQGYHAILFSIS